MSDSVESRRTDHIAEFGETLDFYFVHDGGWCYPRVVLAGAQGTSATLHGQHMSPDDVEKLGKALVKYAETLRQTVSPV